MQDSVNLYCCHYLEGLLFFTLTPEEHCTGVVHSALMSNLLIKSFALEWLALCLITCALGFIQPWFTNFSRHMIITGKVILFITLFFVCLKI